MTNAGLSLSFEGAIARIEIAGPADPPYILSSLLRACDDVAGRDGACVAIIVLPDGCLGGADAEPQLAAAARALELLPQPVIACAEGATAGAALEIALACDVRIAGAGATFSMAQVAGGRMPSGGGTQRLPRVAGRGKASEMILLGVTLDAEEALACGLVNTVTADGEATAEGLRLAARIAAQGPLAVRYAKEAVLRGLEMPLEQALRYETDLTVILQTTHDRDEGVRAFLEKRAPRFEGR